MLDEATSSLDSESEQAAQQALGRLMKNRTTVIIAHRLPTIEHADVIYMIEDGIVVERGTHQELLTAGGRYAGMHRTQYRKEPAAAAG